MANLPSSLLASALLFGGLLSTQLFGDNTDYSAHTKSLVASLTLEEKASLASGRDFWTTKPIDRIGIPSIMMTDGPHGLRKAASATFSDSVPATCFPTAPGLAATWNPELLRTVGAALGDECQANDVQILLGPGVNMKRSPLGGRNFEYYSEDPLLSGTMAAAFIQGVQSKGVGTSLKHFAANNQEYERMLSNSLVDERALREIYLPAFEIAVREGAPWTVMCSYNMINGTPASHNPLLLDQILRKEWGFKGLVVSDWGAVSNRVAGVRAGLNLEMPSSMGRTDAEIVAAVRGGKLEEKDLDARVEETLAVILRAHESRQAQASFNAARHHALARRVGGEAAVLLKNDKELLPLDLQKAVRIAVVGAFAQNPRYQGAGSSQVRATQLDTLWVELKKLGGAKTEFLYAPGYNLDGTTTEALLSDATKAARAADFVIVAAGLPDAAESEGYDRASLDLPEGHNQLIETIVAAQPQCAVVLMNGSAVRMPWAQKVPAIVEGWLGGQAGGGALADVLTGVVNPSGKLTETFPVKLEDSPTFPLFPGLDGEARYGESVFIGYRWYDTRKIEPLFPFGHGLSYTTFSYVSIDTPTTQIDDETDAKVNVRVKNTGKRSGQEVVQLYIHERSPRVPQPVRQLRHFQKVELAPGEEKVVTFNLQRRDFAYWDVRIHDWAVHSGMFDVQVGGSSRELPLSVALEVQARHVVYPKLTRQSLLKDFRESPAGRIVFDEILQSALGGMGLAGTLTGTPEEIATKEKTRAMMTVFIQEMQVWKLVGVSGGRISEEAVTSMLERANKNP